MKRILLAGAAVALIASPAAAQTWGTATYGNDGAAHWALDADVATFCKLGSVPAFAGVASRSEIVFGENGQGGTAANGDGTMTLKIQNPSTNTIQMADASINYANSQCNTKFDVVAESQNGGLTNTAFGTDFDTEFTDKVPYDLRVTFDTLPAGYQGNLTGSSTLIAGARPTAGQFGFHVIVRENTNKLLLEGTYKDFLKVTMKPQA